MNKVLITGGRGHLGKLIVQSFKGKKHPVRVLTTKHVYSRENLVEYCHGDLALNSKLETATKSIDTVIHCASSPKNFDDVDITGTLNLLNVVKKQNVKHFVHVSIVGVDKSDYPYYTAKSKAEELIAGSGIPYTILRATQFHNFILTLIKSIEGENSSEKEIIYLPEAMHFQPVDALEVAQLAMALSFDQAKGLLPDIGGPEVRSFDSLAEAYFKKIQDRRKLKFIPTDNVRHKLFRSGVNLSPKNNFGKTTWEEFLQSTI